MGYRFAVLAEKVRGWAAAACAGAVLAGCASSAPLGPNSRGVPFGDFTLQNMMAHWPSGQEYIEGTGTGRPPEGEKNTGLRRRASRDEAAVAAQKQLIAQLEKLVPRERIRGLLHKAEVGRLDYTYDDGCTLTLRITKEAVVGYKPIE